jgi:hypothetical protein
MDDMIRDVLGKLQMLADAPTQNLDPNKVHESKTKSKPPTGVGRRGDPNKAPRKEDVSLFEWYSWHFASARAKGDIDRLKSLYLLAQADYVDFRFRPDWRTEMRKGELDDRDISNPIKAEEESAERVVRDYEGLPALYVALIEGQNEAWVRKARGWNDRDPDTGRPKPEFLKWDEARRKREVEALQALGLGSTKIAETLGVAKNTVKRYMAKQAVEREVVAA